MGVKGFSVNKKNGIMNAVCLVIFQNSCKFLNLNIYAFYMVHSLIYIYIYINMNIYLM